MIDLSSFLSALTAISPAIIHAGRVAEPEQFHPGPAFRILVPGDISHEERVPIPPHTQARSASWHPTLPSAQPRAHKFLKPELEIRGVGELQGCS